MGEREAYDRAAPFQAWWISQSRDEPRAGQSETEEWCAGQADTLLKRRGLVVDEGDRGQPRRTMAAVMQRASLEPAAAARGEPLDDPESEPSRVPDAPAGVVQDPAIEWTGMAPCSIVSLRRCHRPVATRTSGPGPRTLRSKLSHRLRP